MSMVQQAVEIGAPLHAVYEQLATFENYPQFMTGVQRVTRVGADRTHWIMEVEGHRREFDAQITERSLDQRVSWATTEGPLLAETITLRPMGEARTQIVAQLEADVAYLLPSDRHGQETLSRRLKADLNTFKGLIEAGRLGDPHLPAASSKDLAGMSRTDPASPASVAARARGGRPHPGAGWGTSAGEFSNANAGTDVDITSAPGITSADDLRDVLAPGRRIGGARTVSGGAAAMGGKAMGTRDLRGDGVVNEEERGGDHDW
ncbi:SRPBCC family protein [Actinoplanes sp. NPDC049599]|uniref:SRPBCC family protein n=1 Tax=Actinoplanes sp. NPDC049599 TaxID=3363903 RepID=UPI0037AE7E42